jgi:hypothetical protein
VRMRQTTYSVSLERQAGAVLLFPRCTLTRERDSLCFSLPLCTGALRTTTGTSFWSIVPNKLSLGGLSPLVFYPPAKAGHMAKRRVGLEYSPSMLEPVRPGALLPDRALCLPTFSHFVIVNKTSLSLPPPTPPPKAKRSMRTGGKTERRRRRIYSYSMILARAGPCERSLSGTL